MGEHATTTVSVIGLGEMGSALAGAFLDGGHPVTVWNRTPEKADALVAKGAARAESVREAVAASELVVVNVKGNDTVRKLLEPAAGALAGRAVANLTDGTSAEARAVAAWVGERGGRALHGQIMTIAPGIGHPDAVVFFGGDTAAFERYRPALGLLAGHVTLVGDDAGTPVVYGMAMHGTMWGLLNGFLHAAALLGDAGVPVKRFLADADASMASLLAFLPGIADEVDRGEHATPFGALKHHLPSIEDLAGESRARGIDTALPATTLELVRRAVREGHADDSYSRLVQYFRSETFIP
ncbi:NAD(P)-dependent oxidoreductase [Spirillospora sp. CA-253888]